MHVVGMALPAPSGLCQAGYYCTGNGGGAMSPQPTDGTTGNICPAGNYCKEGSVAPVLCPIGTYSSATALTNASSCSPCSPGRYCSTLGLLTDTGANTGLCTGGYYCPGGQSSPNPTQYICPSGNYCPEGSGSPMICPAGQYQTAQGKDFCELSPAGSYTTGGPGADALGQTFPCPVGYYCPPGTSSPSQYPCPNGTFSNLTSLNLESQCWPCTPGSYCLNEGISEPTGLCHAGYFCVGGAKSATPLDGITGNRCPTGQFCVEGTSVPKSCPAGTSSESTGNEASESCTPVPRGYYSDAVGVTAGVDSHMKKCSAGWLCTGGSDVAQPNNTFGYMCTAGHYCPEGTVSELGCEPGTYNNKEGQGNCTVALAGRYAPGFNNTATHECPLGYYCVAGSANPEPCPAGTFGATVGLQVLSACSPSPEGTYTFPSAQNKTTGVCMAGYACITQSASAAPQTTDSFGNGPCPVGHYCLQGQAPIACESGDP